MKKNDLLSFTESERGFRGQINGNDSVYSGKCMDSNVGENNESNSSKMSNNYDQ